VRFRFFTLNLLERNDADALFKLFHALPEQLRLQSGWDPGSAAISEMRDKSVAGFMTIYLAPYLEGLVCSLKKFWSLIRIGSAIVERLAQDGFSVAVNYPDSEAEASAVAQKSKRAAGAR
jgi:hypothetical protein